MIGNIVKGAGSIVKGVRDIVDELHTSDEEMARAELELAKLDTEIAKGQMAINKVEASHPSIFVAGWRPMIGWIGAVALGWQFILLPITETILTIVGADITIPKIDYQPLFTLIMGMLGVGAMRSYDKLKGTDTRAMRARNKVSGLSDNELRNGASKWIR